MNATMQTVHSQPPRRLLGIGVLVVLALGVTWLSQVAVQPVMNSTAEIERLEGSTTWEGSVGLYYIKCVPDTPDWPGQLTFSDTTESHVNCYEPESVIAALRRIFGDREIPAQWVADLKAAVRGLQVH